MTRGEGYRPLSMYPVKLKKGYSMISVVHTLLCILHTAILNRGQEYIPRELYTARTISASISPYSSV